MNIIAAGSRFMSGLGAGAAKTGEALNERMDKQELLTQQAMIATALTDRKIEAERQLKGVEIGATQTLQTEKLASDKAIHAATNEATLKSASITAGASNYRTDMTRDVYDAREAARETALSVINGKFTGDGAYAVDDEEVFTPDQVRIIRKLNPRLANELASKSANTGTIDKGRALVKAAQDDSLSAYVDSSGNKTNPLNSGVGTRASNTPSPGYGNPFNLFYHIGQ